MINAKWNINAAAEEAEVWLYGDIGDSFWGEGISAKDFVDDLAALPASISVLHVRIDSQGGDVFAGLSMFQALTRHLAHVIVDVDAIAASAASVVAMGGNVIRMADTSSMMVHEPYTDIRGARAKDLRDRADVLDHVTENVIAAYSRRPDVDPETIRAAMVAETWYSASQAVASGLADEIVVVPYSVAASSRPQIHPDRYANTPPNLICSRDESDTILAARTRIESARRKLRLVKG